MSEELQYIVPDHDVDGYVIIGAAALYTVLRQIFSGTSVFVIAPLWNAYAYRSKVNSYSVNSQSQ